MADNMPTLEELVEYYNGEEYLNLLNEFSDRSKRELRNRETDMFRLFFKLAYCQRRYMVLNVPFSEVLSAIETCTDTFIDYQVAATEYFDEKEIDTTYLIERFCEYYLLHTNDKKLLMKYLFIVKTSKTSILHMPQIYARHITNLYNQTISNVKQ